MLSLALSPDSSSHASSSPQNWDLWGARAHRTQLWEVGQSCSKERGVLALQARPGSPPTPHTCLLEPGP